MEVMCETGILDCYQASLSIDVEDIDQFYIDAEDIDVELNDEKVLSVGACFDNSSSFKQVLRTTDIRNNFGIKIKVSDILRVIVICSQRNCPWRVRPSICADGESFEIRRMDTIHTCLGVNRAGNKLATSTWAAKEIQGIVKKHPDIPPKQIKNGLETTYGLSLPYMKLWRSRKEACNIIFGAVDDNYKWVLSLHAELIRRNQVSHITYSYDSVDNSFTRFYVSFKVCIDGFLVGCRHLVVLDTCHLKSKYLGVLLSANSLDGNNGLFTLAFAVVESEPRKTWEWFLQNFYETIGGEIHPLAFISDMEKGLGEAIHCVFPDAEPRVCLRHLWKNLKKHFQCPESHKLRSLVWSAANAYTKNEFDELVIQIYNISPHIYSYLLSLPYKWSRSDFSYEIKSNHNTSNNAESFNAWIGEARGKPIVDLIDMIRGMLMEQRAERKMKSASWHGALVPYIDDYIREITRRKDQFIIRQATPTMAEVEGRRDRQEVDIEKIYCTCGIWQMTGLPCIHIVALIGSKELPLWHIYVDEYYHVNRYKMAYDGAISTMPNKEQWKLVNDGVDICTPTTLRPRGRPKKKRFKNFLETNQSKSRNVHKCSRRGFWGHHRSTCKNPIGRSHVAEPHIEPDDESSFGHMEGPPATSAIGSGSGFREKLKVRRDAQDAV